MKKSESKGTRGQSTTGRENVQVPTTRQVTVVTPEEQDHPLSCLFSSSDEEDNINLVRVQDCGSHAKVAKVQVQGFPAEGIIDSGADITIINGKLFPRSRNHRTAQEERLQGGRQEASHVQ